MALNLPNIATLRKWLTDGALHQTVHFNMSVGLVPEIHDIDHYTTYHYTNEDTIPETCESACCLAGATVSIMAPDDWLKALTAHVNPEDEADWGEVRYQAQELLGLTSHQANELFEPDVSQVYRSKLTIQDSIQALDNLVADPDDDPWRHITDDL